MNAEIDAPGLSKMILSQSVMYALGNVRVAEIDFLALPVLSWILGLEVYDKYVVVYQIISVFGTLISGWATSAYLRYCPESIEKNNYIQNTNSLTLSIARMKIGSQPPLYGLVSIYLIVTLTQ